MRDIPPLNALKAFEASGRHLNFRRASEELGVTQGAVAQQVRGLEAQLNVTLFERQARGLALTDAGRRYLAPISRAFEMIAGATEELRPRDSVVTISTTPSFATRWLVPRLGAFSDLHPEVRVRLDAANAAANFQSDGVDIAVRLSRPPFAAGLTATRLLPADLIAVCHPDLASGPHPITTPDHLIHHVLLEDSHGNWPVFLEQAFSGRTVPSMREMKFSQTSLAIDAALSGQGIALTSRAFVDAELSTGRLCQPLPLSVAAEKAYFIVAPRGPRNPALVDLVRNWLLDQA